MHGHLGANQIWEVIIYYNGQNQLSVRIITKIGMGESVDVIMNETLSRFVIGYFLWIAAYYVYIFWTLWFVDFSPLFDKNEFSWNTVAGKLDFYAPDRMVGGILFCPVFLSVCLFVCLLSTLTFAITFELQEIETSYLTCILH